MPPDRQPNLARREDARPTLATRATPSLPAQLRGVVPDCAKQCLTTYIDEEYNCPENGFTCLCQNYSSKGFTLGELAYICLHQNCRSVSKTESGVLYSICDAQANAVSPTLTLLTAPATSATPSHSPSSITTSHGLTTTAATLTTSGSKTLATAHAHHSAARSSSATMKHSTSTSTTQSASVPMAAAASSSPHAKKLSGPQAAGIAVAVIGAVALLIAAVVLFICLRRRKKTDEAENERRTPDSIRKIPTPPSPEKPIFTQPPRRLPQRTPDEMKRIDRDTIRCWQLLATQPTQRNDVPNDTFPGASDGQSSTRTISKPLATQTRQLPPVQTGPVRSGSDDTTTTVFEDEEIPPVPPVPSFDGFGLPANPLAKPTSLPPLAQRSTLSPTPKPLSLPSIRPPSLSLDIPKSTNGTPRIPARSPARAAGYPKSPAKSNWSTARSPGAYPRSPLRSPWTLASPMGFPPLAIVEEEDGAAEQAVRTPLRTQSRDSSVSLLNYYASPDAGAATFPSPVFVESPTPFEVPPKKRKAAPSALTVTKPSTTSQAARRDSNASDTSFESTDPDEPTPPDEDERQLTPVQESPILESSPIADIRYPRIPRSSNQAIPRSPAHGAVSPPQQRSAKDRKSPKPPRPALRAPITQPDDEDEWPLKSPVTPKGPASTPLSLGGSTLVSKRLGSNAAQNLKLRLEIPETAYSPDKRSDLPSQKQPPYRPSNNAYAAYQESPLKGYGREVTSPRRNPRVQSKSNKAKGEVRRPRKPAIKHDDWEPTLTPEKRGEDLYLQFGLATPKQVQFMI